VEARKSGSAPLPHLLFDLQMARAESCGRGEPDAEASATGVSPRRPPARPRGGGGGGRRRETEAEEEVEAAGTRPRRRTRRPPARARGGGRGDRRRELEAKVACADVRA
jgi:hypothetical protein